MYLGPELDDPRLFLDGALRWVGLFFLASAAAPVTFVLGIPRFLWQLLPDDVARAWPSLLAFPVTGLALLLLRSRKWTKAVKAAVTLFALAAASVLAPLSDDVTEGLWSGLPGHFWHHAPLYLAAFALLTAGARMAARGGPLDPSRRRAALRTLAAGSALLLVFYLLPQRAEVPLVETVRGLFADSSELPTQLRIGLFANRLISLSPLVALLLCGVCLARRRFFAPSVLYAFFIACLPLLCLMGGLRAGMTGSGMGFVLGLRNAALLGGLIVASAAVLEALTSQLLLDLPQENGEPSPLWRDRLLGELATPVARALNADARDAVILPDRGFGGLPLTAATATRLDSLNPLLRRLLALRVAHLRAERDTHGDPSQPLADYVAWRVRGVGPCTGAAAPSHAALTEADALAPLPAWAFGQRLGVVGAGAALLLVALWFLLSPPGARSVEWTPKPADAAVEPLFAHALPRYIAALSAAHPRKEAPPERRTRLQRSLAQARDAVRTAATSLPGVAAAFERFADLAERFTYRPRATLRAILAIDEASRAASLPFSVEPVLWTQRTGGGREVARPWRRHEVELRPFIGIKVFRVRRVRHFEADGARYTTAWVSRLDHLNLGEGHLGRSRDAVPYALVLEDETRDFSRRTLAEADGQGVRRGGNLLELLTRDTELDDALLALTRMALAPLGPAPAQPGEDPRLEPLARAIMLRTERHELEHEADTGRDVPSVLHRLMSLYTDAAIRHAARELRAYLAEMATAPLTPGAPNLAALTLARLLRLGTSPGGTGSAESFAGRVAAQGFGRALGLETTDDAATRGRGLLAREVATRCTAAPDRVPELARTVYAALFGSPPMELALVAEHGDGR